MSFELALAIYYVIGVVTMMWVVFGKPAPEDGPPPPITVAEVVAIFAILWLVGPILLVFFIIPVRLMR